MLTRFYSGNGKGGRFAGLCRLDRRSGYHVVKSSLGIVGLLGLITFIDVLSLSVLSISVPINLGVILTLSAQVLALILTLGLLLVLIMTLAWLLTLTVHTGLRLGRLSRVKAAPDMDWRR